MSPADRATEPGTIAISFVTAALQAVGARGLDADELLVRAGLSPGIVRIAQARVSARQYGALWRLVALALDDEFFGQDSRRMKVGSFAMQCQALLGCSTLGEALQRSLRFYALILDELSGTLTRDAKHARITLHGRDRAAALRVFAHETLLMLLHGVACWLVGRRIPITRAEFSYPEPAHSAEYRLMYSTDLRFGQADTAIMFDAAYLDLPLVQDEGSLREFLRNAPGNILVKYKNRSSLGARIRRRLRQSLPGRLPDFERVATEMRIAAPTLRRRLQQEGTSYRLIKDQLRRDLAIGYLAHSTRDVLDIALELGFAERSAFHRAFCKWTGTSPAEFRRRQQP